jgi:multiple sugar transport system ATP-binding protein
VADGKVEFAGFSLPAPPREGLAAYEGRNVILGIRPSDFDDAALGRDPHLPTIPAVASVVEELGSEVHVLFGVDAPPVSSDAVRAAEEADEEGGARLIHDEAQRSTFTARVSAASQVKVGEPITLTVNCEAMHVFDPATGDSIGAQSLAATGS